jgi:hypothetical protein
MPYTNHNKKVLLISNVIQRMIKPFTLLIMTLLASSMLLCGQSQWESWEQNYREVRYAEVLELEKQYADSIEGLADYSYTISKTTTLL